MEIDYTFESKILAMTYYDVVDIFGGNKNVKDEFGITQTEKTLKSADNNCSISTNLGQGDNLQNDDIKSFAYAYGLFLLPTVDIKVGDIVKVKKSHDFEIDNEYEVTRVFNRGSHLRCTIQEYKRT